MLIKLFHYEIKSLYKEYLLCLFSFFSCVFVLNFFGLSDNGLVIFQILEFFIYILLFASVFYPLTLIFKTYKGKISSNEAYINLTLPVETWQQVFVSMFTGFCLIIFHSAIIFNVFLLQIARFAKGDYLISYSGFYRKTIEEFAMMTGLGDLSSLFTIILIIISFYALFIGIIYSSITLGQFFKSKSKILIFICFFLQFLAIILIWDFLTPEVGELMLGFISVFILTNFIIAFALFLLSSVIMTKHLNLE